MSRDEIHATWIDSRGNSCNFCTDYKANPVLEVKGHCLIVRFCRKCLEQFKRQANK